MPLLPHVLFQLPHPGESPDGSETTKITKQHNYDKVTDIWARWYTANTNAKSQSALEITHSMSLLYDAWWIKGTDSTIISMQGNSAIYTPSYNVVGLIVTLGAVHCMDTCTHY